MKNPTKVLSTVVLIAGLANVVSATPVDDNRRPLYVVKLSKYHWNDSNLGQSPYNGGTAPNGNHYWGHWVKFNMQILDNNNQPYGLGNPREQFHNYGENPTYASRFPDRAENEIGDTWSLPHGQSTFTDNNALVLGSAVSGSPSTDWFWFDQRWHVIRRSDNASFRTDSLHHLHHTQDDVARTNG